jgi:hypothetical protein
MFSFMPRLFYLRGKSPRYPLDKRFGWPQGRSRQREEKILTPPAGLELWPLGRLARSQSLYRLRYPGSRIMCVLIKLCRWQWPSGLRHQLSFLARTLGRGLEPHSRHRCLYCVCLFCVCVVLCVGNGFATGWSPVQEVLPTVYRIKKLKERPRPNKKL